MDMDSFGRARGRWGRRFALSVSTILASGVALPALAQDVPPPPVREVVDEHGVNLVTGQWAVGGNQLSIGSGERSLTYTTQMMPGGTWSDSSRFALYKNGTTSIIATVGMRSIGFDLVSGVYVNSSGGPETLTGGSGSYTLTLGDGTVISFSDAIFDRAAVPGKWVYYASNTLGVATTVTKPDGEVLTFYYKQALGTGLPNGPRSNVRLRTLTSSNGYALRMETGKIYLYNMGSEYCDPNADTCTLSGNWPKLDSAGDSLGRLTIYTSSSIRRPTSSVDNVTTTSSGGYITSVTEDGISWNYNFVLSGTTMTATVTNPDSSTRTTVSDTTIGQPTSVTDERGKTSSFTYDTKGRLLTAAWPEGNQTQYTYDGRGNLTQTTSVAKSGSGLSNIVVSAGYDTTCTNPKTCNQPNWTKDPKASQTDYTYDTTHGGLLTVTAPAPAGSGDRPQTRITYSTQQAWYKNSAGTLFASGVSTYLPTGISSCSAGSSCASAATETKVTIGYQTGSSSAASNLLPNSQTVAAGDASVSATSTTAYDAVGNVASVDGPLSGSDDTMYFFYDAVRQQIGTITPDSDGAGLLSRRALRTTYNADGLVTITEQGAVTGTSLSDLTGFSPWLRLWTNRDAAGRKSTEYLAAGPTLWLTQYSYDGSGRLDCTAQRMNSATWTSLPGSACMLATAGSYGPDRITKNIYDAAGNVTKVQTGYGVSGVQADEVTTSYTDNGAVASVTDAEGNKTSYSYDGFDRLWKTFYPNTTKGSGASSSTDYEQLTYDTNSNVTSRRLRDGNAIGLAYDLLNRLTAKDLPGSEPDVAYTYDLLGRMTGASQTGNALSFGFDALGRNTSQGGPLGTVSYQYNAAGRRTRITWPDSFYVSYDYLLTGEVSAIRENGATSGIAVLATYIYNDLGQRQGVTYGNGATASTSFTDVRPSSFAINLAGTASDVTTSFTLSPANQIASQARSNDSYAWGGHYKFGRNYTANGLNQYTASGPLTVGHDARGNTSSLAAAGWTDTFSYSSESLLTSATINLPAPVLTTTLSYDPALRLYQTQTVTPAATTRFQYDGADMIAEYNGSNVLQKRYIHGAGTDEPLVEYAGSGTGAGVRTFLQGDERGSIVVRSDESGAKTAINSYDEYGIPAAGNVGRFQYTGQTWLPEIGVFYYKARIYSPSLGRFLQTDPIGYDDGMNWYGYVRNDPVNYKDPFGLDQDCLSGEDDPGCDPHSSGITRFVWWRRILLLIGIGNSGPGGSRRRWKPERCKAPATNNASGGVWLGASLEGGLGGIGAGGQQQLSRMKFSSGTIANFYTRGGFAGGPGWGATTPATPSRLSNTDGGAALGLAGGAGGGLGFSNARDPGDLAGAATTLNVNVGFFSGGASWSNAGTYMVNLGVAKGAGLDVSYYPTYTSIISEECGDIL